MVVSLHFIFYSKQAWCWMQGDLYRSKQKELSKYREKHAVSRILSGVDDMKLDDVIDNNNYSTAERLAKYRGIRTDNRYSGYNEDVSLAVVSLSHV